METLRRTATRTALVGLLVLGAAACNGDGGGETQVDEQATDPLSATE